MISYRLSGEATGSVGTIGFYNETTGRTEKYKELPAQNAPSEKFEWIKLGPFEVKKGYLYVAPTKTTLQAIDVERIILLRQE